jgi:hypothetical protein
MISVMTTMEINKKQNWGIFVHDDMVSFSGMVESAARIDEGVVVVEYA